jgi:diguanylate cyclase (GGDEF)-like protein
MGAPLSHDRPTSPLTDAARGGVPANPSDGRASARSLLLKIIIAGTLACVAIAVTLIGLTAWTLRSDAIDDASIDAGNIATVLAEQTARSVQSIDLVLTELQDHVRQRGITTPDAFRSELSDKATFDVLKERLSRFPEADVITLVDDKGMILNLTRQFPAPKINISDRSYFQYFREFYDNKMFIAAPLISHVNDDTLIFFTKRISGPEGDFLGVALIALKPTFFRNIYETITALREQSFELVREDGAVMVRYPRFESIGDRLAENSPWQAAAAQGGGEYRIQDAKSVVQIAATRPTGKYPLFVNVSIPQDSVLANWKRRTTLMAAGTVLVILCPAVLLLLLRKLLRSVVTSETRLEENAREVEKLNTRLDLAFNNMSQGLCFFDGQRRLIVCNERYMRMYGLAPDRVKPGMSLEAIVDLRYAAGTSPKMSREAYLAWRDSVSVSDKPSDTIVEINNGNFYRISHRPMPDGGWVATHEDVTASKRDEARISYMAHHDALTGLASRSYFTEKIEEAQHGLGSLGRPFGLLMLDLDRFKAVNDSRGHAAGDALLKEVARRLCSVTSADDVVARLGGDEFAIITFGATVSIEEAPLRERITSLARQIIALINEPFLIEGNSAFVGTSVGVALAPDDGVEAEELLKKADLALYKSKSQGRNGFTLFDARMMAETSELHKLENEMRAGLARGEFEVHYQPIVDARTETIRGAEALLRWRHPELGLVPPARFIPLAESTGLIVDMGEFVLNRACRDAVNWPGGVKVAVNLSAVQFRKANLFDLIMAALGDSGLSPARLEVEVTESVLLENESDCAALLHRLKKTGVSVALDDFGTGYSSLSYLKQFPFDKIKIDRSFTADVADDAGSMAIVSAIVGLSRGMDMITTAEGIETESQLNIMRAAGVTLAQGYLFGRPCPAEEFISVVARPNQRRAAV